MYALGCGRLLGLLDDELDPAGADPIAGLECQARDALVVDEGAVRAFQVLELQAAVAMAR